MYVCLSSLACVVGLFFVYVAAVYWFCECSFLCLIGCFMIVWTPTVFRVSCMHAFSIFVFAPVQRN